MSLIVPCPSKITINNGSTIENFMGQFQQYTPMIICVVDSAIIQYYERTGPFPTNIRFDHKRTHNMVTEYYFLSVNTNNFYCVFGKDNAKIFCPGFDDEPKPDINVAKTKRIIEPIKIGEATKSERTNIIIIDKGVKLTFKNYDYPIDVYEYGHT